MGGRGTLEVTGSSFQGGCGVLLVFDSSHCVDLTSLALCADHAGFEFMAVFPPLPSKCCNCNRVYHCPQLLNVS